VLPADPLNTVVGFQAMIGQNHPVDVRYYVPTLEAQQELQEEASTGVRSGDTVMHRRTTAYYTGLGDEITTATHLIIVDGLATVPEDAFKECTGLTEVTLPDSVVILGTRAFYNCLKLTTINLSSVQSIESSCFSSCGRLVELDLRSINTPLGEDCFKECALHRVYLDNFQSNVLWATNNSLVTQSSQNESGNELRITLDTSFSWDQYDQLLKHHTELSHSYPPDFMSFDRNLDTLYVNPTTSFWTKIKEGEPSMIALPEGLQRIPADAFADCSWLTEIALPESVAHISERAFRSCVNLTTINLSDIQTVEKDAFNSCVRLEEVDLRSVTALLGTDCFKKCPLRTVHVFNHQAPILWEPTNIVRQQFQDTDSEQEQDSSDLRILFHAPVGRNEEAELFAHYADSPYEFPVGFVSYDSDPDTPDTPDTLYVHRKASTWAPTWAQIKRDKDPTVVLPEGLQRIPEDIFAGCSWLTEVTLPASLTHIGAHAFRGSPHLAVIVVLSPDPRGMIGGFNSMINPTHVVDVTYFVPTVDVQRQLKQADSSGVLRAESGDRVVHRRTTAYYATLKDEIMTETHLIIEDDSLVNVPDDAFKECALLTRVTLPETVRTIGTRAFMHCAALVSVALPETLTSIGEKAFMHCTALDTIRLPEHLGNIGTSAFYACVQLSSIVIPVGVVALHNSVFYGCTALVAITLPETLTSIGTSACMDCTHLTTIDLSRVTELQPSCFSGCSSLEGVVLSSELTVVPASAFGQCGSLATINLSGITMVGARAFEKCGLLTVLDLQSISEPLGNLSLSGCTGLVQIQLSDQTSSALHEPHSLLSQKFADTVQNPGTLEITFLNRVSYVQYKNLRTYYLGSDTPQYPGAFTSFDPEAVTNDDSVISYVNVSSQVPATVVQPVTVTDVQPVPATAVQPVPVRAHAGGDPYIYPVHGSVTKMPNTEDVYRLYQDDTVVINARVSKASPVIQKEIAAADRLGDTIGMSIVSSTAHFFSHIHIARLGTCKDSLTVDLEQKTMSDPTSFSIGTPRVTTEAVPYDPGQASHVSIPVCWDVDMCLRVTYSKNPQVRNGLSLQGTNIQQGSGLLIRNYRPRLFRLNTLESLEPVVLPKNIKRVTTNRGTSGQNECTVIGSTHTRQN
jgi:hypothetical protein